MIEINLFIAIYSCTLQNKLFNYISVDLNQLNVSYHP